MIDMNWFAIEISLFPPSNIPFAPPPHTDPRRITETLLYKFGAMLFTKTSVLCRIVDIIDKKHGLYS